MRRCYDAGVFGAQVTKNIVDSVMAQPVGQYGHLVVCGCEQGFHRSLGSVRSYVLMGLSACD